MDCSFLAGVMTFSRGLDLHFLIHCLHSLFISVCDLFTFRIYILIFQKLVVEAIHSRGALELSKRMQQIYDERP